MDSQPVLVNPTLVRLPNGREVSLSPGLMEFQPSDREFVVRYDQGPKTLLRGAETERGTVTWQILTDRDVKVRLSADRRTVTLPAGSATFEGPVREVRQIGDTFVVVADLPGAPDPFFPEDRPPRSWGYPPRAIVGLDVAGREQWRLVGYSGISSGRTDRTVTVHDGLVASTIDAATGAELDSEQDH